MPGFFKRGGHSARSLLRHCAQVGITRAVDIVQSRPVETHDRQAKLRAVKQRQKRRRRPVRHNGDMLTLDYAAFSAADDTTVMWEGTLSIVLKEDGSFQYASNIRSPSSGTGNQGAAA